MALEEQNYSPILFPRFKREGGRKLGLGSALRDDNLFHETAAALDQEEPILSSGAFVDELDQLIHSIDAEESMDALVTINPAEVRALIRLAAKAKGRYLAALVDSSGRAAGQEQSTEMLRRLRERHEELSQGVATLRTMILSGQVQVKGVNR